MKGFPNQVADLAKLATGMRDVVRLVENNENARDEDVLGEAFVRSGVAGTGHEKKNPVAIDDYLAQQRQKKLGNQSHRATARGMRELFVLLELVTDDGKTLEPTGLGREAAGYADSPMDDEQKNFWRRIITNISHDGGDGESSHPYQVLLRLIGQKPGLTRDKRPLALEARNDSPEELARIVGLADLSEDQILEQLQETENNWENANKVLPSFASQLGDIVKNGKGYWLADAPGRNDAGPANDGVAGARDNAPGARAPRTSRKVTADTIARMKTADDFDEREVLPPDIDQEAAAEAIRKRTDRWRRHQGLVQELARRLGNAATFHEGDFDMLALIEASGILVEVKTLDGSPADERDRVRGALGQLLYYEAFVTAPVVGEAAVYKVACFEGPISDAHRDWLNRSQIAVLWKANGAFAGDELATRILGDYLEELG